MPYWFIANGRRFIVIVRVSSVYQSAYAGFILPYHLPNTFYPALHRRLFQPADVALLGEQ